MEDLYITCDICSTVVDTNLSLWHIFAIRDYDDRTLCDDCGRDLAKQLIIDDKKLAKFPCWAYKDGQKALYFDSVDELKEWVSGCKETTPSLDGYTFSFYEDESRREDHALTDELKEKISNREDLGYPLAFKVMYCSTYDELIEEVRHTPHQKSAVWLATKDFLEDELIGVRIEREELQNREKRIMELLLKGQ